MSNPNNSAEDRHHRFGDEHPIRQMIRRVRKAEERGGVSSAEPPGIAAETLKHSPPWNTPRDPQLVGAGADLSADEPALPSWLGASLPSQIGRFRIDDILGRGGFGIVFLAHDPQLNRAVALKIPRLEALLTEHGAARFVREARAAALLGHPQIVTVYEAGQVGPLLYIAFERIDGLPLSEWLQTHGRRLEPDAAARLIAALASGVQHAHQRGIIHRDLKPANIMVVRHSDSSSDSALDLAARAKITDFGLAHLTELDGLSTHSGATMGTPLYAAPEQLEARADQVGPAADVYSLGAILYELLTGRPPFAGTSLAAIARAVAHDLPAPPSRLNGQVAPDLEAICWKCLEKDPAQRYSSASELGEDLERFLGRQPVRARRWSRRERMRRWIKHNRTVFTLAILVFLSLTAGLIVAIYQSYSLRQLYEVSERHRVLAETNSESSQRQQLRAERHLARAEAAIDALLNDVADALEPIPQMESLRRQLLESALEHERGMLAEEDGSLDNRLRLAHSLGRMADLQMRLGMFAEAQETARSLEQLQDHFISAEGEQHVAGLELVAKAQLLIYAAALERGDIRQTSQQIQNLLDQLAQWNEAEQHPSLMRLQASAWSLRAMAAKLLGQFEEAQAASRAAVSVLERIPADHRRSSDELDLLANRNQIANIYSDTGNNLLAIDIWRDTLERELDLARQVPYQSVVRANHTITRINLASALAAEKEFEEANEHYRQAIEELANWCDQFPLHFRYFQIRLAALTGFGSSLQNQGDIGGAIAIGREATAWGQEVIDRFGDDPRALASYSAACGNLGNLLYYYRQDAEAAEGLWESQLRCARRLVELQPDSAQRYADLAFAFGNLAGFQLATKRLEEAEMNIREALHAIDQAHLRSPTSTSILVKYRRHLSNLMLLKCMQHDVMGALEASQRIISFNPIDVEGLLLAASTAARCQQAVVQNTHDLFGQADDQEMADRYATCCLEFLAAAKSNGFDNFSALHHRPEFALIITRPEFAALSK